MLTTAAHVSAAKSTRLFPTGNESLKSSNRNHNMQGGKHDVRVFTQGWLLEPLHPRSLKCHDRACQVQSPRFAHQAFASGASMCSVSAQQTAGEKVSCSHHQSFICSSIDATPTVPLYAGGPSAWPPPWPTYPASLTRCPSCQTFKVCKQVQLSSIRSSCTSLPSPTLFLKS